MDKTLLKQKIVEWEKACDFFATPNIVKLLDKEEKEAIVFLSNYWRDKEFDKDACQKQIDILKHCDKLHSNNRDIIEKSKTLRGIAQTFYTKDFALFDEFRKEMGWTPSTKKAPIPETKKTPVPTPKPDSTPQHDEALIITNVQKWSRSLQYLKSEEITPQLDTAEITAIEVLSDMWRRPSFQPSMKEEAADMVKVLINSHKLHSNNREIIEHSKNLCAVARKMYEDKKTFDIYKKALAEYYQNNKPPRREFPVPEKKKKPIPQSPRKDSELIIRDVLFADTTYENKIIKDFGRVLFTNTQYIVPRLSVASEYYGTETIEIILKYPNGETCSYDTEVTFNGKGDYTLAGWGSKSGTSYASYGYVEYTFKCKGKKLWQGRVTIGRDGNSPRLPEISTVKFGAVDYDGNIKVNFGSPIPTGIPYLKPRIVVSNNFRGAVSINITFEYKDRDADRTTSEISIQGPGEYDLTGWGRKDCTYWTENETVKVTFSCEGKVLYTTNVKIGSGSGWGPKKTYNTPHRRRSSGDSLWSRFDDKIRSIGDWLEDDSEEMLTSIISVILFIILVIGVVFEWIDEGLWAAILTGVIGFIVLSLGLALIRFIMPIIVFVLRLVFKNAWTFLIALIFFFGPSIVGLVGGLAQAIFASIDSDEPAIEQVVTMPTSTYYCTAQSGVIVRQSPSKTAAQLGGLQYNEEVEVYEIQNGYARIDYYGNEAWVSSQYITMSEGEAFLIENAKRKEVKVLPSGLQYEVVKKGKGKKPYAHSDILCTYTCELPDGTLVDSATEPVEYNLGGVIKGFAEGVMQMKEGAHYILYIPANLGYGSKAVGNIPPHATVIYDVTLVEILDR
jgi:FKBP-type peptidyl-prolyl cis-trans isomerase FklB